MYLPSIGLGVKALGVSYGLGLKGKGEIPGDMPGLIPRALKYDEGDDGLLGTSNCDVGGMRAFSLSPPSSSYTAIERSPKS